MGTRLIGLGEEERGVAKSQPTQPRGLNPSVLRLGEGKSSFELTSRLVLEVSLLAIGLKGVVVSGVPSAVFRLGDLATSRGVFSVSQARGLDCIRSIFNGTRARGLVGLRAILTLARVFHQGIRLDVLMQSTESVIQYKTEFR
jgi:hypothetical protein